MAGKGKKGNGAANASAAPQWKKGEGSGHNAPKKKRGKVRGPDTTIAIEAKAAGITRLDQVGLTDRQRMFVDAYFAHGGNATEALRSIVPPGTYSEGTLRSTAYSIRESLEVRLAIHLRHAEVAEKTQVTTAQLRDFYWRLAHDCAVFEPGEERVESEAIDEKGNKVVRIVRVDRMRNPEAAKAAADCIRDMDRDAGVGFGVGGTNAQGKLTHEAVMHMLGLMPPGRGSSSTH